jgi:hypothetical protein
MGAVAGGAAGGVVALLLAIVGFLYLRKRRAASQVRTPIVSARAKYSLPRDGFAPSGQAERPHRPLTVHVDTQDEAAAPAEIKVVREPPALPPPALVQTEEAEAPAAAQPSDVQVVLEEADDAFDADALSPLPVVVPPAEDELRRLEAEFAARDDDGRQESKDTQQRVLGLLSDALGKAKEYKDGRFMLIRGSEPEKGATGMVLVRAHPPCDDTVSG